MNKYGKNVGARVLGQINNRVSDATVDRLRIHVRRLVLAHLWDLGSGRIYWIVYDWVGKSDA
jgi:hypothetical protein